MAIARAAASVSRTPSLKVREEALVKVEIRLGKLKHKPVKASDFDEHIELAFPYCMADLDMSSVPGNSIMNRFGTTNGEIFKWDGQTYDRERAVFFKEVIRCRMAKILQGELESDPINLFIKQEPHKLEKIEDGRLRLISSVSLTDSMIDRVLFLPLALRVVYYHYDTYIMVGWSPVKGGYRFISHAFDGKVLLADRSSWDWTMQPWMLKMCLDVILNLAVGYPDWWRDLVIARFKILFDKPIFKFSDGQFIEQPLPGIMKSGCYLTIFLNSLAQFILHACAFIELGKDPFEDYTFFSIGDDTAQDEFEDSDKYLDILREYGLKLKVSRSDVVEFAGFELKRSGYIPAYENKHRFNLSHLPNDKQIAISTLQSYQLLYYFKPSFLALLDRVIDERGLYEAKISRLGLKALAE